ncbi:sulfate adenylyltransferase, partial [Bacillus cereus]|nr:sulfate adenylyltransferase [Bacillus cereus]
GVGAFSPLTGFMNESDYRSVVTDMRLADGTVWSIPITLAVVESVARELKLGQQVALVGETDGTIYAVLDIESIYQVDQAEEARRVFKTDDPAHPGVNKLLDRPATYVGGSVQVLNRPEPTQFSEFYYTPSQT